MPKSIKAADAFAALGLTAADYTDAMRLAVKQNWTNLPTDVAVSELREKVAAVTTAPTPTSNDLAAGGHGTTYVNGVIVVDREACNKEAARLKRNAAVNAWRERNRLQAALDARDAKFAKMRAAKAAKASGKVAA